MMARSPVGLAARLVFFHRACWEVHSQLWVMHTQSRHDDGHSCLSHLKPHAFVYYEGKEGDMGHIVTAA